MRARSLLLLPLLPLAGRMTTDTNVTVAVQHYTITVTDGTVGGTRSDVVRVAHTDTPSGPLASCTKIQRVQVMGLDLQNHDLVLGARDLGGDGLCNFNPNDVSIAVTPFSDDELRATCATNVGPMTYDKLLTVLLLPNRNLGSSLAGLLSAALDTRFVTVSASITCGHAQPVAAGGGSGVAGSTPSVHLTRLEVGAPQPHVGLCPQDQAFTLTAATDAAGGVAGQFEFSDGARTSLSFPTGRQARVGQITTRLTASRQGWVRFHATAPTDTTSTPVSFSALCLPKAPTAAQLPPARAGGAVAAPVRRP